MLDPNLFRYLFQRVGSVWLTGCVFVSALAVSGLTGVSLHEIAKIAIASGFISVVAILPFSRPAVRRLGGRSVLEVLDSNLGLFVAFSIGMTIRVVGTVALFLACRYQMVATDGEIATFVLGWYVYLTLIEISLVALKSRHQSEVHSVVIAERDEVAELTSSPGSVAPGSMAAVDG